MSRKTSLVLEREGEEDEDMRFLFLKEPRIPQLRCQVQEEGRDEEIALSPLQLSPVG